jgi:hypothetical protein
MYVDETCGLCKNRLFLTAMCTAKIATEWLFTLQSVDCKREYVKFVDRF